MVSCEGVSLLFDGIYAVCLVTIGLVVDVSGVGRLPRIEIVSGSLDLSFEVGRVIAVPSLGYLRVFLVFHGVDLVIDNSLCFRKCISLIFRFHGLEVSVVGRRRGASRESLQLLLEVTVVHGLVFVVLSVEGSQ